MRPLPLAPRSPTRRRRRAALETQQARPESGYGAEKLKLSDEIERYVPKMSGRSRREAARRRRVRAPSSRPSLAFPGILLGVSLRFRNITLLIHHSSSQKRRKREEEAEEAERRRVRRRTGHAAGASGPAAVAAGAGEAEGAAPSDADVVATTATADPAEKQPARLATDATDAAVVAALRARGLPARLFAEPPAARKARLAAAERATRAEGDISARGAHGGSLRDVVRGEDARAAAGSMAAPSAGLDDGPAGPSAPAANPADPTAAAFARAARALADSRALLLPAPARVLHFLEGWLDDWRADLAARSPDDATSPAGRRATQLMREADVQLRPLRALLRAPPTHSSREADAKGAATTCGLADDVLIGLALMVEHCHERNYRDAGDCYLKAGMRGARHTCVGRSVDMLTSVHPSAQSVCPPVRPSFCPSVHALRSIPTSTFLPHRLSCPQVCVGNAAWPIGVGQVGVQFNMASRDKIRGTTKTGVDGTGSVGGTAHVMVDETTRKWLQAWKRLMTAAQRRRPSEPSRSLDYGGEGKGGDARAWGASAGASGGGGRSGRVDVETEAERAARRARTATLGAEGATGLGATIPESLASQLKRSRGLLGPGGGRGGG